MPGLWNVYYHQRVVRAKARLTLEIRWNRKVGWEEEGGSIFDMQEELGKVLVLGGQ